MRLIPYDTFILDVVDPPSVVMKRLEVNLVPEFWLWIKCGPFFEGKVSENGFKLRQTWINPLASRPLVLGQFVAQGEGTRVEMAMRYSRVVTVVFAVYISVGLLVGLILTTYRLMLGMDVWAWPLLGLALALHGYLVVMGRFWIDAPPNRREITRILSGG